MALLAAGMVAGRPRRSRDRDRVHGIVRRRSHIRPLALGMGASFWRGERWALEPVPPLHSQDRPLHRIRPCGADVAARILDEPAASELSAQCPACLTGYCTYCIGRRGSSDVSTQQDRSSPRRGARLLRRDLHAARLLFAAETHIAHMVRATRLILSLPK